MELSETLRAVLTVLYAEDAAHRYCTYASIARQLPKGISMPTGYQLRPLFRNELVTSRVVRRVTRYEITEAGRTFMREQA